MVIINGIVANLERKPITTKTAQKNSAKTVSINDGASPIPNGLAKPKSPENNFESLGNP